MFKTFIVVFAIIAAAFAAPPAVPRSERAAVYTAPLAYSSVGAVPLAYSAGAPVVYNGAYNGYYGAAPVVSTYGAYSGYPTAYSYTF